MDNKTLKTDDSYSYCAALTKARSNFYRGIIFNRPENRKALFAVYAWMRFADDIADNGKVSITDRKKQLSRFSEKTERAFTGNQATNEHCQELFWSAFINTVQKYHLPYQPFQKMIECQKMDLEKKIYKNNEELIQYCRLAASSVGQIFINICGYNHKKAEKLADKCGIAFQLTNILKDINDDLERDRIYLPTEYFEQVFHDRNTFQQIPEKQIHGVIIKITQEAETLYNESFELVSYLENGKLSFLIAYNYYYRLLQKLKNKKTFRFEDKKIKLSRLDKLSMLLLSLKQFIFS